MQCAGVPTKKNLSFWMKICIIKIKKPTSFGPVINNNNNTNNNTAIWIILLSSY